MSLVLSGDQKQFAGLNQACLVWGIVPKGLPVHRETSVT